MKCKRVKKAYVNYMMPLIEITRELLESQKEKEREKGQEAYLKK